MPASYNDLFTDQAIRDHVGWVWYQRMVRVPRGWAGERIIVRVDAATHEGVVYVNDVKVAEHVGGYLPFEADVTDHVAPGEEFRLTIGVNNELTMETIPPGVIEVAADGRRMQKYFHDFYNYAGLARSVWLTSRPAVHVFDVTVVTRLDGTTGLVDYRVETEGDAEVRVRTRGCLRRRGRGIRRRRAGTLEVDDAKLWRPGAAYLYDLTMEAVVGGEVVDEYGSPSASARSRSAVRSSSSTASRSTSPDSASTRTRPCAARATTTPTSCTTSSSWTGSARTRSAPRTTRTPRRSWTSPTATASS